MRKIEKILKHPITIILSTLTGVALGLFHGDAMKLCEKPGKLLLTIILINAIPVLLLQIITGISSLFNVQKPHKSLLKSLTVFVVILITQAAIGSITGFIQVKNSKISDYDKTVLNSIVESTPDMTSMNMKISSENDSNVEIRTNPIILLNGKTLRYLFFCLFIISCVVGCINGLMKSSSKEKPSLLPIEERLLIAFRKLYDIVMCLMPVTIILITGNQCAKINFSNISGLRSFLIPFSISSLVILILSMIAVCIKKRCTNPFYVLYEMLSNALMSLGTGSICAVIPKITEEQESKDETTSVLRFANTTGALFLISPAVLYTSVVLFFAIGVYNYSVNISLFFLIFSCAILVGVFSVGLSVSMTLVSTVIAFTILKIPSEPIIAILITAECICIPIRAFIQVCMVYTASIFTAEKKLEVIDDIDCFETRHVVLTDNDDGKTKIENQGCMVSPVPKHKPNARYCFVTILCAIETQKCVNEISKAVLDNGGTANIEVNNKKLPEYYEAFWCEPDNVKSQALNACAAALTAKTLLLGSFNGSDKCQAGVGISGCGAFVGFQSVSGDDVEMSRTLAGLSEKFGTVIVVTEKIYNFAKDEFDFRILDRDIVFEGKSIPAVYELLAKKETLGSGMVKLYNYYETGLAFFFTGKYDKTIKYMNFILSYIKDKPSVILKERAEKKKIELQQ